VRKITSLETIFSCNKPDPPNRPAESGFVFTEINDGDITHCEMNHTCPVLPLLYWHQRFLEVSHVIPVQRQPDLNPTRNSTAFSSESLKKLQQIMYVQYWEANVNVFREGDASNSLYFVQSGKVKLTKLSEEGKDYIMSLFHAGDFFGQLDPSSVSIHPFSATTLEKCTIGVLQRGDLEVLLWQHGDLAIDYMNWMAFMHRLTQTKFRDLMMLGKPGALCSTLIRLSNTYGIKDENGIQIRMKLTNAELAHHIGCARESVNRMLGELKRAGAVQMNDGMITITDLPYLQSVCKCEMCSPELCRM